MLHPPPIDRQCRSSSGARGTDDELDATLNSIADQTGIDYEIIVDRFGRERQLQATVRTALRIRMMRLVDRLEIEHAQRRF